MRVADYFAAFLADRGVSTAFLLSGGQQMHLTDAWARKGKYVCCHHEQACAYAADGYAQLTGKPGVVYATGGPGGLNAVTGIASAYQDSVPMIVFTGQSRTEQTVRGSGIAGLRQRGVFEVDIIPVVQSVTKYAAFVDNPKHARYHMERAWHEATTGRPGPVLLDVPLDVQSAEIDPERLIDFGRPAPPALLNVDRVIGRLLAAERPLILAGRGVRLAGAVSLVRQFVDAAGIPVVTTAYAKDLLDHDHPLFVGCPGLKGDRAGNFAVQTADFILALGCSLHTQTVGWDAKLFAPCASVVQVDPDPAVLSKGAEMKAAGLCAEVGSFLRAALETMRGGSSPWRPWTAWQDKCQRWKECYGAAHETRQERNGKADLYDVVSALSDVENAVFLTDAGQPIYAVPQALRMTPGQRHLAPAALAQMGWALPAAIGAAQAEPERTVIAVVGDGSFQMNAQELQTLAHHRPNVKIVVICNGGYRSIRLTQEKYCGGRLVGSSPDSGVTLPDVGKLADAYGLPFAECGANLHLLRSAVEGAGPMLCAVRCREDQLISPYAEGPLHLMKPDLPADEVEHAIQGTTLASDPRMGAWGEVAKVGW